MKVYVPDHETLLNARNFIADVQQIAERKYPRLNYFIVSDGASRIRNTGNDAIRTCREALKKWEDKHGFDANEDWRQDIRNTDKWRK